MSESLHPLERKILASLETGRPLDFDTLVDRSGLGPDQIRRALQWLESKGLVIVSESAESTLEVVRRPPELSLVAKIRESGGSASMDSLRKSLSQEEFSAALGRARASGWVQMTQGAAPTVSLSDSKGPDSLARLMESIQKGLSYASVSGDQRRVLDDLLKRGAVRRLERKQTSISLTARGKGASEQEGEAGLLDKVTPEVLASRSWRGKTLRPIDVVAKPPVFYPGRRHPVRDFIREVKEAYVSMGFTEVDGESVHTAFWNFDALFVPQDHPGREMQDTFYLEGLSDSSLKRTGVVANVASTHEDGWKTGSRGWEYLWRIEEARRLVLRTHNTVLTVKALSESKERETRVFAVSKVYRNENLDYKHLAEFYQMDGIIVGQGLNVRHLMGFLTEFYKKLGMKDVKLWPTYFPYTEPSLEVVGFSPISKSWIELSGSGVFRPEVTFPLGVKVPVLAWGPGIERLMLMRYGLDDLRDLYGSDLSWLRNRMEFAGSTH
ncbi:MAG: phenylalanine--tRNA ligase subunit alpha [archaeon]|nr:MAG: phenylalanine--tRNA ligase subunit alpha [archaeon]